MEIGTSKHDLKSGLSGRQRPLLRLPKQIVIVDDNEFFVRCLSALIEHDKQIKVCSSARSSGQLLEILRRKTPDLFLIDLNIGSENGLDIAEKLRRMKVKIPILLTSTHIHPSDLELETIGNCRFISKHLRPADLLKEVKRALEQSSGRKD